MSKRRHLKTSAARASEPVLSEAPAGKDSGELIVMPASVARALRKLQVVGSTPRSTAIATESSSVPATEASSRLRSQGEDNRVVVACDPPFAAKFLAPRLTGFLEQNPELDVRVVSDFGAIDHEGGNVDIGIHLAASPPPDLYSEPLGEEQLVPLASGAYVAKNDLSSAPDVTSAVLLDNAHPGDHGFSSIWDEWMVTVGVQRSGRQRVIDFGRSDDQAIDAAIAGAGVVLGRSVLAYQDIMERKLVCPFGPLLSTGMYYFLSHRNHAFPPAALEAFKTWLRYEMSRVQALESELLGLRTPSLLDSGFPAVLH